MTDRNYTLDPAMAICSFCPWELACTTPEQAAEKKAVHEHLRHNQPLPEQSVTGGDWQAQAVDALRTVAGRGQDFRVYDALAEFGLQSPPNHKSQMGRLATLAHDMGIAHPVGADASTRPGTKRSQAGVWNRNPARCTDQRCRAKAGAAA